MSEFGIICLSGKVGSDINSELFSVAWHRILSFNEWWLAQQKDLVLHVPFIFLGTVFDFSKLRQFVEDDSLDINFYRLTEGTFYELLSMEKYKDKKFMLSLLNKANEYNEILLESDNNEINNDYSNKVNLSAVDVLKRGDISGIQVGSSRAEVETKIGLPKSWVVDFEHTRRGNAQTWVYDGLQIIFNGDTVSGWSLQCDDDRGCLSVEDPYGIFNSNTQNLEFPDVKLIPLSEVFPDDSRSRRRKNTFVPSNNSDIRIIYSNDGRIYKISLLDEKPAGHP
jgi:hypothetical protein